MVFYYRICIKKYASSPSKCNTCATHVMQLIRKMGIAMPKGSIEFRNFSAPLRRELLPGCITVQRLQLNFHFCSFWFIKRSRTCFIQQSNSVCKCHFLQMIIWDTFILKHRFNLQQAFKQIFELGTVFNSHVCYV